MRYLAILTVVLAALVLSTSSGCSDSAAQLVEEHHEEQRKLIVTSPAVQDVITTEQYVCQIHSCRHIEVCALESGYLEEIR
ncbi:MAG: efflux RND transporter periplasmic adaptor subunit, partial [Pirellulales bacterium]